MTSAPAESVKGRLRQPRGDVRVKRGTGDEWMNAVDDMPVYEDDKVRTAQGASAVIQFENGTSVALGESALIAIAETRPAPGTPSSDVTLFQGRVDANLKDPSKQSLLVTTPSAQIRAGREIVFQ